MFEAPIRSLIVSDFRRIEGTRVFPFDAPIVLIHGSNGTGKTSVLSALELALTGSVRSMERQDDRYAAHLPFLGQPYATVRASVADWLGVGTSGLPLTVNGARIDGTPALYAEAAKFYSERCYLDQASLGRLLELYQFRAGKEESALARFVNELLGLEKLDALRSGLHDATDFRLLRKLVAGVDVVATQAKDAASTLTTQSGALANAREELQSARNATIEAIEAFSPGAAAEMSDAELLEFARTAISANLNSLELASATAIYQELIALGGRISALTERPSMQRISDARAALQLAATELGTWIIANIADIEGWDAAARDLGAEWRGDDRGEVRRTATQTQALLDSDEALAARVDAARAALETDRVSLDQIQTRLAEAREFSSSLIESLVGLRAVVGDNVCPVCDRDYAEIGETSLAGHIDAKLTQLTGHGQQLVDLRGERDRLAARIVRDEVDLAQLDARLLPPSDREALNVQQGMLVDLVRQLDALTPTIVEGEELTRREREAREALADLESASSTEDAIRIELEQYAARIDIHPSELAAQPRDAWQLLVDRVGADIARRRRATEAARAAAMESTRFATAIEREAAAVQLVVNTAQRKSSIEAALAEARRRQAVANEVHDAATRARTAIVQRVFTESLNSVWRSVFTRLAPNEGFIPRFGIPTATKTALDIKLETTHRSGEAGGPPQMMLSAGNLNTAALSLFLALHLAVDPLVPCLVFDDPVQAMDEVHVSQFAGLIRVLAKQHDRQVVIAVHERELFDYLALELSPAYDGDELITIELGDRALDEDEGITRRTWAPDLAIAG
jgi:exonuclease SbcC